MIRIIDTVKLLEGVTHKLVRSRSRIAEDNLFDTQALNPDVEDSMRAHRAESIFVKFHIYPRLMKYGWSE